jgi:hypothetical protein
MPLSQAARIARLKAAEERKRAALHAADGVRPVHRDPDPGDRVHIGPEPVEAHSVIAAVTAATASPKNPKPQAAPVNEPPRRTATADTPSPDAGDAGRVCGVAYWAARRRRSTEACLDVDGSA